MVVEFHQGHDHTTGRPAGATRAAKEIQQRPVKVLFDVAPCSQRGSLRELAVSKPVNFMVGIKGKSFSVSELAAAGVKRISLATSLYRAAMTAFLDAANEVRDNGQFSFLERCVTTAELNKLMRI